MVRFAYNKQLELKISTYKETGKNLSQFDLNNSLVGLKQEHKFLKKAWEDERALLSMNQGSYASKAI